MKITDRIKSFEDACKALEIETTIPGFQFLPESDQNALIAHYKLIVICRALNEDWTPDWENGEWDKWYPWFWMDNSSAPGRFSFNLSADLSTYSAVGSRLCYRSQEISDYAGKQFEDLYRQYFIR